MSSLQPRQALQTSIPSHAFTCFAACWLLVAGCWLLVTGCCLLVATCCLLLVAGCRLLVAGCWLLTLALFRDFQSPSHWEPRFSQSQGTAVGTWPHLNSSVLNSPSMVIPGNTLLQTSPIAFPLPSNVLLPSSLVSVPAGALCNPAVCSLLFNPDSNQPSWLGTPGPISHPCL